MCPGDSGANGPAKRDEKRKKSRQPRAVADLLDGVLEASGLELAAPSAAVGENWEAIVGSEVARHSRPVGIKAGVLHADVDSSVWCQQLQLRSPEILAALKQKIGAGAPTEVRFRVGYSRPPDESDREPGSDESST